MVEGLLSRHKAMGSTPRTEREKEKETPDASALPDIPCFVSSIMYNYLSRVITRQEHSSGFHTVIGPM